MSTVFNPDALDFTPQFLTSLSPFAVEFSPFVPEFVPTSAEFIPSSAPPEPPAPAPTEEPAPEKEDTPPISAETATISTTETPVAREEPEEKPEVPVVEQPESTVKRYNRELILSLRDACRVLPPDAAVPDNYCLVKGKKGKGKPVHAEKWATLPVYTLETSANSFANYVKNLSSEQEKEIQQVRLLINKITQINYTKLLQQLFESYDYSGYLLEKLSWLIYERATMHHGFSEMYAKLCVDLKSKFIETGKADISKRFRIHILEKCEKAFYKEEVVEGNELIDAETKRRVRLAGNVKFIGHLFQLKFISPRVVHECFQVQLNEQTISDESIETFCMLFTSVAPLLRTRTKDPVSEAAELREAYERVVSLRNDERFSLRIRFMIQTLIDKRSELLSGEIAAQVTSPPLTPSKESPVKGGDSSGEIRRIKIPPEVNRELKEILSLQKKQLPAKTVGQKVHSLAAKHTLHRPEVVYQICRFALSECVQSELDYFANLIVKSFMKKKAIQPAVSEGLGIAVLNLKDLRLDCPMAEEWLRVVIEGVRERDGLSDEQREALLQKIAVEMAVNPAPIAPAPVLVEDSPDVKVRK